MADAVTIWVVYDHPKDYPAHYVARKFEGEMATPRVMLSRSLGSIRDRLRDEGLVQLARDQNDDEKILETWL